MNLYLNMLVAFFIVLASCLAHAQPAQGAEPTPSTAIDVLLDPDAIMLGQAKAANERLRNAYLKGFALDETHQPHISFL